MYSRLLIQARLEEGYVKEIVCSRESVTAGGLAESGLLCNLPKLYHITVLTL